MRADLAALSPEAVASLSNMGLVKRALREIEAGSGPTLSEKDGVVTGVFPDGIEAKLPPEVALGDAPCTCGSPTVCRHRVAVALAYGAWVRGAAETAQEAEEVSVNWDPGTVTDATLLDALGKRTFERARLDRRRGMIAEVRRSDGKSPPQVRLATCTITFLVPDALNYARCDCERKTGCEHVALGVWAFIEANRKFPDREVITVSLEEAGGDSDPLAATRAVIALILHEGVAHLGPAVSARIQQIAEDLEPQGYTWVSLLLTDLIEQLQAYRDRSARYSADKVHQLLIELEARRRAATGKGELPASFVLGQGESRETKLAQLRLISLGARIAAEGTDRLAETCFADPDSGTILVHQKRWTFEENPPTSDELGTRLVTSGVKLNTLATGQIITRNAKRLANREVLFGAGRAGTTSVTGQNGDWSILPAAIRVEDVKALLAARARRPPWMLRPRQLAEDLHVVQVAAQGEPAWSPVEQEMVLPIQDPAGNWIPVVATWRSATPHRTTALARAAEVPLSWVCGRVIVHRDGPRIEPISVVAGRLRVLDLEAPGAASFETLPSMGAHALTAAQKVSELLDELAHEGLARGKVDPSLIAELREGGWVQVAGSVEKLGARIRELREDEGVEAAVEAWLEAAMWVALVGEGE